MKPFTSKHCTPINYGSPLNDHHDEPEVKREELDDKGKKIYDELRKKNDSLLKSGMTQKQINAMRLKRHKEKNKNKQK
jgi:hypothetical protein